MTDGAAFWDKVAPKYAKANLGDPVAYRETLERTLHHLSATDAVLELGCGTATTALEIAPHVAHLTATDISAVMIGIGQEKLAATAIDNLTLRVAGAEDPALSDAAPYDAILAHNMLHLVDDQAATLTRIHALLKPGGLFISKTPCLGERWFFRPLIRVLQAIGKAPRVLLQRQGPLLDAIHGAGFNVVETLTQPGTVTRAYVVARKGDDDFDTTLSGP